MYVFGIEIWACLFTVLGVFVRIKGAEYCFVLAVFFVMIFLLFIGCGFVPISHLFFYIFAGVFCTVFGRVCLLFWGWLFFFLWECFWPYF